MAKPESDEPVSRNLDWARAFLKEKYVSHGFKVDDREEGLLLSVSESREGLSLKNSEVKEYLESSQQFPAFSKVSLETGICSADYREQLVEPLGRTLFIPGFGEKNITFGSVKSGLWVEVGPPSVLFYNFFRFSEFAIDRLKRDLRFGLSSRTSATRSRIGATIRVQNLRSPLPQIAFDKSTKLIESCLFSLSYIRHRPFALAEKWPESRGVRRSSDFFEIGERTRGDELPMPPAHYDPDMVQFYQLGVSNDNPILRFLGFYQVLEYQFVTVSNEKLYQRLQHRVQDPKFNTSPKQLGKLVQDVLDHNRETDEERMLRNVIEKYVDPEELIEFIKKYDASLGAKTYIKQRNLFGREIAIRLEEAQVSASVAAIIKTVRNALVHSSDRYGGEARHIPFSKSTEVVRMEIPIVRFLAEKAIIGSGEKWPEPMTEAEAEASG